MGKIEINKINKRYAFFSNGNAIRLAGQHNKNEISTNRSNFYLNSEFQTVTLCVLFCVTLL